MFVHILRGLPGSGKSTWAASAQEVEVFSADQFHVIDGCYKFDPKRSGYAHNQCLRCFTMALIIEKKTKALIVDNTNTTVAEIAPYVRLAEAFGVDYMIHYLYCSLEDSITRNIHKVPVNTILQMEKNLRNEILPPYWKQEVHFRRH